MNNLPDLFCPHRRATLLGVCLLFLVGVCMASNAASKSTPVVAVPYYTATHFVQGALRYHLLPLADRWLHASAQLVPQVQALCEAKPAQYASQRRVVQGQWQQTLSSWVAMQSVVVGPLVDRRTQRRIDFQPVRSQAIERAVAQVASGDLVDVTSLEGVGAPARGLPALEWLLWKPQAAVPRSAACRYAVLLSQEVQQEALAVQQGFATQVQRDWADQEEQASAAMADIINQWLGAVEALRWRDMGQPLLKSRSQPEREGKSAFARALSLQTFQAWHVQWRNIRPLTVQGHALVPEPGQGVVSVELYLRGRGLNALADKLQANARRVDVAMAGLPDSGGVTRRHALAMDKAVQALGALRHLIEAQVAPALQVHIGFSDADGD